MNYIAFLFFILSVFAHKRIILGFLGDKIRAYLFYIDFKYGYHNLDRQILDMTNPRLDKHKTEHNIRHN